MTKLKNAVVAALALGLASGLPVTLGAGAAQAQGGPAFVKVDNVKREPLSQTVAVVGRLVARQFGTVASRSAGLVDKVLVEQRAQRFATLHGVERLAKRRVHIVLTRHTEFVLRVRVGKGCQ